jgi:hypothetical protein
MSLNLEFMSFKLEFSASPISLTDTLGEVREQEKFDWRSPEIRVT